MRWRMLAATMIMTMTMLMNMMLMAMLPSSTAVVAMPDAVRHTTQNATPDATGAEQLIFPQDSRPVAVSVVGEVCGGQEKMCGVG